MGTGLASEEFWEDTYLSDVKLPARPDPSFQFERVLAAALASHAPVRPGASVIEIGCAPATWLGFYAERFGARVTGIEYTGHGADLSRRNLAALGVDGEVVQDDFFDVDPSAHDLVLSLGFIEHFTDLDGTFAHHAAFVAPGGMLVLGVPNYRGLMGLLQRVGDPAHLAMHNTAAMHPALWRRLGTAHGMEVEWEGYLDGPDPDIIAVRPQRRWLFAVIAALDLLRRVKLGPRLNASWVSAYLLVVLRRPRS
jgi:SAM-dependent methyltransferase